MERLFKFTENAIVGEYDFQAGDVVICEDDESMNFENAPTVEIFAPRYFSEAKRQELAALKESRLVVANRGLTSPKKRKTDA